MKSVKAYLYGHIVVKDGIVTMPKFSISNEDLEHATTDVKLVCIRIVEAPTYTKAFHKLREKALLNSEYSRYWEIISEQLQKLPIPA